MIHIGSPPPLKNSIIIPQTAVLRQLPCPRKRDRRIQRGGLTGCKSKPMRNSVAERIDDLQTFKLEIPNIARDYRHFTRESCCGNHRIRDRRYASIGNPLAHQTPPTVCHTLVKPKNPPFKPGDHAFIDPCLKGSTTQVVLQRASPFTQFAQSDNRNEEICRRSFRQPIHQRDIWLTSASLGHHARIKQVFHVNSTSRP